MTWPTDIPVADNFARANEDPIVGWSHYPSGFYTLRFHIETLEARGGAGASGDIYTAPGSGGANQAAAIIFGVNGGIGGFGGVVVRNDGVTADDGYALVYIESGNVLRVDGGGATLASTTQVLASNDGLLIAADGTSITSYYSHDGGATWSHVAALDVTDSSISHGGYGGFFGSGNSVWYGDFLFGVKPGGGGGSSSTGLTTTGAGRKTIPVGPRARTRRYEKRDSGLLAPTGWA